MSAHSANRNSLVVTPQRCQEAISIPLNPDNIKGQKGLLDDLDPELMAKIVAKVTKKLKGSWSDEDKKENEFFYWATKQNPKTYYGQEAPVLLKEWIRPIK